ncbi:MAG: RNA polymerase sigma factor [Sedimentisphaerales bacterium]|nr:RNA polymerase sigma factor [Sedimentisphaerales bacterium]
MESCENKKLFLSKDNINRHTYSELVRDHSARIFAVCFSMLSNREDAEDVTQQAFLKGYSDIKQLRDINKFGAWITHIAKRMCLDLMRRRKLNKIALKQVAAGDVENEPAYEDNKYPGLQSALMQLKEEYRLPLMLYYFDGKSTKKIAESLEITVDLAHTHLSRARKKLRQLLSTRGGA